METGMHALSRRRRAAVLWSKETELENRSTTQRRGENQHIDRWVRVSHWNRFG
jgi:hypothetical protein